MVSGARWAIKLQHVHVQFVFGEEVDGFQHSLLVFSTLVAVATETAVCHLVVFLGLQVGDGNILTVHTGIQPAAAVKFQQAVHGKQYAAQVRTGQNTAVCIGVDMYYIVQYRIFGLTFNTKIFQKTQTETVFCVGLIENFNLTAPGHHHTQILFQFFCGKVDHVIGSHLLDLDHIHPPKFVFFEHWHHNTKCWRFQPCRQNLR